MDWVDVHLHHHAMRKSWLFSFWMAYQPEHRLFRFLLSKATLCSAYCMDYYVHLLSTAAVDNMQLMRTFVVVLQKYLYLRYHIFNAISGAHRNLWWFFLKLKQSHFWWFEDQCSKINTLQCWRNYLVKVDIFIGNPTSAIQYKVQLES